MDKPIDQRIQDRQKRKPLYLVALAVIGLAVAWFLLRQFISPSLSRSAITIARVEKGNVENTLQASGEVLPEFEEVISSPIQASVQSAMLDAGSQVKPGQAILQLDKSATETMYTKLKFQLESKRNEIRKLRLQLSKSFFDIQSNDKIKQLSISSLEADVENAKRLLKAGGGTREDVEKAELRLKVARLEKLQLENEIRSKQETMKVEMREAEIAASIQENELAELSRKLDRARVVASRAGVITYVNKNIGASVNEGDVLVRIADLNSFKVQGSLSDNFLDQVHVGLPAIVNINDVSLRGTISNIQPTVQNGVILFDVQLEEKRHKSLRPNMKVEVFLVTASHNGVLRVANGPAFKGAKSQELFVVSGNKAIRKTVPTGLSSFDFIELNGPVKEGDQVIISDMSEFNHMDEITLTDNKP